MIYLAGQDRLSAKTRSPVLQRGTSCYVVSRFAEGHLLLWSLVLQGEHILLCSLSFRFAGKECFVLQGSNEQKRNCAVLVSLVFELN